MPLSPAFTINATRPINPAQIVLDDTSSGNDANIVGRQILIYKIDNTLLSPAIPWALADPEITLTLLTQDIALNTLVQWLDINGGVVVSTSQIFAFDNFSEQFLYSLTQAETANPAIINSRDYLDNKSDLTLFLDSAQKAINTGKDIYAAQNELDKAINMVQQHQLYFNV